MPFNPSLPVELTEADAAQMRAQFNGLNDLIQAIPAGVTPGQLDSALGAALATTPTVANAALVVPRPMADPDTEILRQALNTLITSLQRGGPLLPAKPVVTVDGLNTPTQTGHTTADPGTNLDWLLMHSGESFWTNIQSGPADSVDMTGLTGADNFLIVIPSNGSGTGAASDPVQFAGGL